MIEGRGHDSEDWSTVHRSKLRPVPVCRNNHTEMSSEGRKKRRMEGGPKVDA